MIRTPEQRLKSSELNASDDLLKSFSESFENPDEVKILSESILPVFEGLLVDSKITGTGINHGLTVISNKPEYDSMRLEKPIIIKQARKNLDILHDKVSSSIG